MLVPAHVIAANTDVTAQGTGESDCCSLRWREKTAESAHAGTQNMKKETVMVYWIDSEPEGLYWLVPEGFYAVREVHKEGRDSDHNDTYTGPHSGLGCLRHHFPLQPLPQKGLSM